MRCWCWGSRTCTCGRRQRCGWAAIGTRMPPLRTRRWSFASTSSASTVCACCHTCLLPSCLLLGLYTFSIKQVEICFKLERLDEEDSAHAWGAWGGARGEEIGTLSPDDTGSQPFGTRVISEASGLWCLDRVPMRHLNVHGDLVPYGHRPAIHSYHTFTPSCRPATLRCTQRTAPYRPARMGAHPLCICAHACW